MIQPHLKQKVAFACLTESARDESPRPRCQRSGRSIVSILIGLSIACGRPATEEQPGAQVEPLAPNIVFIMADDLGYADLSSYGRTDYSTPALDRLASEGTRFTQAYAISLVCTPTRVGLMTGQYPARHRIGLFEPLRAPFEGEGLDATAPTLSTQLSDAGYHTGLVGKWHLGRESEFRPSAYGFDSWFAILSGGADYVSHRVSQPLIPSGPHDLYQDDEETFADGYLTDLFTEQAEAFLRATDEPFFLNLEYSAPHWPWQQPGDPPIPEDANPVTYGGSPEIYAGMMGALDTGVARMMAVLDELGYAQRTIVIFTSDNGGERFSDMGDLIGAKRQLWEGGVRVPAFVRWPGVVPAGVTTDQVASTLDWTATMLAAGGVDVSADLDGIDLLPHLRGEIHTMERTVFWRSTRWGLQHAVRQGRWKYLRVDETPAPPGPVIRTGEFLFDLDQDPGETTNRADEQPDVVEELRRLYDEWNAGLLTPIEPLAAATPRE